MLSAGIAAFILFRRVAARRRHLELTRKPFPKEWEEILEKDLPPYRRLSPELRRELQGLVNIFLAEKTFEGCGGLEVTDEMRVLIAAEACLLLLNKGKTDCYPSLDSIILYPHAFVANAKRSLGTESGGVMVEDTASARIGESWGTGAVVLAWDHVRGGAADFADGQNVVLHEFGHQLDQASGSANGAPPLEGSTSYRSWGRILGNEYAHLREKVERHRRDVLDSYGATNPAEFFAVATETFFEKPERLREKHPELFEELKAYYRLDPTEWVER